MQSLEPPKAGEGDKIGENVANVSCHASTAPVNSKHPESHVDKTTASTDGKPICLLLKQNAKPIKKQVPPSMKINKKPEIPACIEACDVGSLLDKFLEYEVNQNVSVNMVKGSSVALTPVSSPSHKRSFHLSEAINVNKKTSVSSMIGLTPPVSPPSHHSTGSTKYTSTNPATPVSCYEKCRGPLSLPNRNVIESKKQGKDTANSSSVEKITPTCKGSSDATVNNVAKNTNKENATAATLQIISKQNPGISKNVSTTASTSQGSKSTDIQEQKIKARSELKKPEESKINALQDQNTKLPKSSLDTTGDKIVSGSGYSKQKRCYSSEEEEEEDDQEYRDYKRKKYATRDECYWSTSEDEREEKRKCHSSRKRGHKKHHSRKRCRSRSHSSDSDDDRSYYGKSRRRASHNKREQREDWGKKEESSNKSHVYDVETERKRNFKLDRSIRETSTEKRKIVYIGNIKDSMTKGDVWRRFREYGPIDKVTVHYRNDGDNYSFVTFVDSTSALEAIEKGCKDPDLKHLDMCFGGRRKFCGGRYVDFDSNTSYLEEKQLKGDVALPDSKEEMDFDALLKMCQRKSR